MKKVFFLDRDGIINIDKGYIYRPSDIEFTEGILSLLKTASVMGFEFIIVTNQAGIAKGMYEEKDVINLHAWMKEELAKHNIEILDFFHCPHHPRFTGECSCRKPAPGMIFAAAEKHGINLNESMIIGDKQSDVQAGRNAGLKKTILVSSEYIDKNVPEADFFAQTLQDAERFISECFEG